MKIVDQDKFVLSTGREIYANGLLVSIPIDEDGSYPRDFWQGYDGGFSAGGPSYLTIPEAIEVCDAMLNAWTIHKSALEALL